MNIARKYQRGFSAIMAVILIVLLALMGGYMATLTSVGSVNTTVSAGTMQAWFAARSGIEWAVQRIIVTAPGACITTPTTINLTGGNTNGFTVVLTCAEQPVLPAQFNESGIGMYNVFAITSRATRGSPGGPAYVSRQVNISITDAP
jgi:MSHA biogenesis protein MshP